MKYSVVLCISFLNVWPQGAMLSGFFDLLPTVTLYPPLIEFINGWCKRLYTEIENLPKSSGILISY